MNPDGGKMRVPKHFLHGTEFVICILHPSGSTKYQCPSLPIEALWARCSSCWDTCHHFTLAFICRCLTQLSSGANVCVTSYFHRCGKNIRDARIKTSIPLKEKWWTENIIKGRALA